MEEIERKFLYINRPDGILTFVQHTVIYRKYISTCPEVRINKRVFGNGEVRYNLTLKGEGMLLREEVKIPLQEKQYFQLSGLVEHSDLIFDVYEYKVDEQHSISFKEGRNVDVKFAEIEYSDYQDYVDSTELLRNMVFLTKEVTYEADYYMKHIWEKYISG